MAPSCLGGKHGDAGVFHAAVGFLPRRGDFFESRAIVPCLSPVFAGNPTSIRSSGRGMPGAVPAFGSVISPFPPSPIHKVVNSGPAAFPRAIPILRCRHPSTTHPWERAGRGARMEAAGRRRAWRGGGGRQRRRDRGDGAAIRDARAKCPVPNVRCQASGPGRRPGSSRGRTPDGKAVSGNAPRAVTYRAVTYKEGAGRNSIESRNAALPAR